MLKQKNKRNNYAKSENFQRHIEKINQASQKRDNAVEPAETF